MIGHHYIYENKGKFICLINKIYYGIKSKLEDAISLRDDVLQKYGMVDELKFLREYEEK